MNHELTAEEKRMLAAYRAADPIIAQAALEMLQNHPAEHKPRIEYHGNLVKVCWTDEGGAEYEP